MRSDAAYMDSLVQRYEQRLFELEEIEVELREKLALLEQGWNQSLSINNQHRRCCFVVMISTG